MSTGYTGGQWSAHRPRLPTIIQSNAGSGSNRFVGLSGDWGWLTELVWDMSEQPWLYNVSTLLGTFEPQKETSRNITARVIERDTSGEIYYFLEDSRGFRTHQHGRQ
ncbi:hypothetical protein TNCV_305841 [Trichonephila clavipes]|nr:hypothetical protein TNCV_305841 [Trichonephila clavipes]